MQGRNGEFLENTDQRAIRLWLTQGLKIPEVLELRGDAGYLLNNMIAKYTLFSNFYAISTEAEKLLTKKNVDLNQVHMRRSFYGKQRGKNPFIYEHAVPAKVIRTELLSTGGNEKEVLHILKSAGPVAMILRTEDKKLRESKLNTRMPEDWQIGNDPLARYQAVGIRLNNQFLKVSGYVCR